MPGCDLGPSFGAGWDGMIVGGGLRPGLGPERQEAKKRRSKTVTVAGMAAQPYIPKAGDFILVRQNLSESSVPSVSKPQIYQILSQPKDLDGPLNLRRYLRKSEMTHHNDNAVNVSTLQDYEVAQSLTLSSKDPLITRHQVVGLCFVLYWDDYSNWTKEKITPTVPGFDSNLELFSCHLWVKGDGIVQSWGKSSFSNNLAGTVRTRSNSAKRSNSVTSASSSSKRSKAASAESDENGPSKLIPKYKDFIISEDFELEITSWLTAFFVPCKPGRPFNIWVAYYNHHTSLNAFRGSTEALHGSRWLDAVQAWDPVKTEWAEPGFVTTITPRSDPLDLSLVRWILGSCTLDSARYLPVADSLRLFKSQSAGTTLGLDAAKFAKTLLYIFGSSASILYSHSGDPKHSVISGINIDPRHQRAASILTTSFHASLPSGLASRHLTIAPTNQKNYDNPSAQLREASSAPSDSASESASNQSTDSPSTFVAPEETTGRHIQRVRSDSGYGEGSLGIGTSNLKSGDVGTSERKEPDRASSPTSDLESTAAVGSVDAFIEHMKKVDCVRADLYDDVAPVLLSREIGLKEIVRENKALMLSCGLSELVADAMINELENYSVV
ncbi:hypothetical protein T439DRAFT_378135 [Meredithblackwellia eburnea MCA 4105]